MGRDAGHSGDATTSPLDGGRQASDANDSGGPGVDGGDATLTTGDAGHDASLSNDAGTSRDAEVDAHVDARDGGAVLDAAHAPADAGHAPMDAGHAPMDAGHDVGVDSGVDAGVDSGFDAGPPAIEYVGRIDYTDPGGPRFQWPGTQVIIRFTGTAVTINMTDYGNYFDIYVDGVLQPTALFGTSGVGTSAYSLASGLPNGTHEVIMDRRTEPVVSTTQILGVVFPGGGSLLPPRQRPKRRIEAIGDSISCGLGVLGVGPTCTATNANEDHTDSYEAVAARALGADLITTAWSGKGIYENYGNAVAATIPQLYPYTLPTEPSVATLWNFTKWNPDAVVIDLGTNDFWNGDPGIGYQNSYVALLETIRTNYPNALIVCENGPMLLTTDFNLAEGYITAAIAARAAAGDTRVTYLSFGMQGAGNGYACDYHPSAITHGIMAAALEALLTEKLGW